MLAQLSFKNHFQFGYNNEAFILRKSPSDQWWVNYGQCETKPLNFEQECLRTAQRIRASTDLPLWVLFSGGVDSEVTLRSFVQAGLQVQAAILRFKNDLNIHDISYAVIACEELEVPYKIFDLDLVEFWETKLWDYAIPTQCVSPQLLTTMYLADQIDGYPILGSGECFLAKETDQQWYLWEREKIASWYRHFLIQRRDACPGFFQYTPEIILSYLNDPMVQSLIQNNLIDQTDTKESKLRIYKQYFDLISRPKYTGFEKVQDLDFKYRKQLKSQFPDSDQIYRTSATQLITQLSVKPSYSVQTVSDY